MFMILRLGLKNIDFLGKMKAEKFVLLMHPGVVGGYVPNRERNLLSSLKVWRTILKNIGFQRFWR